MTLDENVRKELLSDLESIKRQIDRILKEGTNYYVKSQHYVAPTVLFSRTDLDHPRSEYKYFSGLREIIEEVILTGKYPETKWRPDHMPDYLEELYNERNN